MSAAIFCILYTIITLAAILILAVILNLLLGGSVLEKALDAFNRIFDGGHDHEDK